MQCIAALVLLVVCTLPIQCQETSYELWPQVDVYAWLGRASRMYGFVSTVRDRVYGPRDVQLGLHYDFGAPPPLRMVFSGFDTSENTFDFFRVRVGGQFLTDLTGTNAYTEYRGILMATPRYRMSPSTVVSVRNLGELRVLNNNVSVRYRVRGELYHMVYLGESVVLEPYATSEWFLDSRYGAFVKSLSQVGTSFGLSRFVVPDVSLAYMRDWFPQSRTTLALNITLAFYL